MRFRSVIEQSGRTATGFEVPAVVVEGLGAGRRPTVCVTINGRTYRSSVASMGGRFMVGVSAENRALTGVHAGDEVEVDLEVDTASGEVEVPGDLRAALELAPEAGAAFARLSYSHQRAHVEAIAAAKRPETRRRRIDRAIEMLTEGRPTG